jgi:hypothetical protein
MQWCDYTVLVASPGRMRGRRTADVCIDGGTEGGLARVIGHESRGGKKAEKGKRHRRR